MGESSSSSNRMTAMLASEIEPGLASLSPMVSLDPGKVKGGSCTGTVEESIEKSKCHWSQVVESGSGDEAVQQSNEEVFRTLQSHPKWGSFFLTFGKGENSFGELMVGQKFAEGGQAEIYDVRIEWHDEGSRTYDRENEVQFVLKVFKNGTVLRDLQSQWPLGMLQFHAENCNRMARGLPVPLRMHCDVLWGTLLEDGRFAFVLRKEKEDLRRMIDRLLLTNSNGGKGALPRRFSLETMFEVALGMDQLHKQGIVHRDIKASNVLVNANGSSCYLADFECSVGVVGTGFFRAPEVLAACKQRSAAERGELFTEATDVYSYGMTCYEILTGRLPFEDDGGITHDLVIEGQRPEVPKHVDGWIRKLLRKCWHSNPALRPSSGEILKILIANSRTCRDRNLYYQTQELERGFTSALDRGWRIGHIWCALKLRI